MPSCLTIKRDHARDARPVTVGRVRAIVGRRFIAGGFQLFDADEIGIARELARQREHQHQSLLGGGDIRPPANRQYF